MRTKEKLAQAIREFNPKLKWLIERAESGHYDDYESPLDFPITQLVKDLRHVGAWDLVRRVQAGEFDGTEEEAMEWFQREGQYLLP